MSRRSLCCTLLLLLVTAAVFLHVSPKRSSAKSAATETCSHLYMLTVNQGPYLSYQVCSSFASMLQFNLGSHQANPSVCLLPLHSSNVVCLLSTRYGQPCAINGTSQCPARPMCNPLPARHKQDVTSVAPTSPIRLKHLPTNTS